MNKIVNFNSEKEFIAYRKSKTCSELGTGSEGTCYLGRDGLAYKDLSEGFRSEVYIPEDIVTRSECSVKSFAFPHVLFTVNGELMGYTSDLVKKDITNDKYLFEHGIDHIDFEKLYAAYEVLYDDAIKLAEEGIGIYDLSFNLMFDGEKLTGVDTCGYFHAPTMECLHNTDCVDLAVKNLFTIYAKYGYGEDLDTDMDVKSFLEMVKANYSSSNGKGRPYIKQ